MEPEFIPHFALAWLVGGFVSIGVWRVTASWPPHLARLVRSFVLSMTFMPGVQFMHGGGPLVPVSEAIFSPFFSDIRIICLFGIIPLLVGWALIYMLIRSSESTP